ncbi:phage baseplate protein [Yeosuana marina]|uniref:phage baseplate protein n=1 Tax=Yeosuana marina TaxID=1565536 RepID=UPI0014212BDE|nr:hypothetical protein [Yeosuana marina]
MNKFEVQGSGFPADNRTWRFIRDMINTVHELTAFGGNNYILKGCEDDNGVIADGFIVLDGELLPFQGGALAAEITIDETVDAVTYLEDINPADGQGDDKNAYFTRFARFGNDGVATFQWADLERLNPLLEIQRRLVPKKSAIPYWGLEADLDAGWVLCNEANNATYGIPDLSGMFIVGLDPNDGDYDTIGKQGGLKEVAINEAQMPAHNHIGNTNNGGSHYHLYPGDDRLEDHGAIRQSNINYDADSGGGNGAIYRTSTDGNHSHTLTTNNKGGGLAHENRPPYYTMAYITYVGVL